MNYPGSEVESKGVDGNFGSPAWFCVRSQMKHEHIAAAHLRRLEGVEAFFPNLRVRKATRRGPVWMTEPLFPNYLFCRFEYGSQIETVRYTPGVSTVIHFGIRTPTIPDEVIEELREGLASNAVASPRIRLSESDRVSIREGAFEGFSATVLAVAPARQRVRILLEMLGRAVTVEVDAHALEVES